MINTVGIVIKGDVSKKRYAFLTDLELCVGDKVVCDTVNGMVIGEVAIINPITSVKPTKFVVTKIDMEAHNERVEREKLRQEREKEIYEIKKQMEKRIKEITDIKMYEKLAETDDLMRNLLNKFTTLSKEE